MSRYWELSSWEWRRGETKAELLLSLRHARSGLTLTPPARTPAPPREIGSQQMITMPDGSSVATTFKGYLTDFCCREGKWITSNPAENVQVRVKRGDVNILSLEEIRRLLLVLMSAKNAGVVAPYLLIQLFGGLRPWEALRLRWERIHFETGEIEVLGETSKTRETRFVPMEPTLIEWLLPNRKRAGPIVTTTSLKTVLPAIKRQAGFTFGTDKTRLWPKDVLRHCYGSYWLAVHKDRAHLAELMGNSIQIIKRHYRRAIPETVAKDFWHLSPLEIRRQAKVIPFGDNHAEALSASST